MAYNKFKIEHLKNQFGLSVQQDKWLPEHLQSFEKDTRLSETLQDLVKMYLGSEKARSEFIVAPVLQTLYRKNKHKFSIFSGYEFNIDKNQGLNGFCDFILSASIDSFLIEAPIFFIVETKKTDIDDNAIAQCGAEMYASYLFNEHKGTSQEVIYGCVTSAYSWAFLKLENHVITIDPNYASLTFDNPYPPLTALQWILNQSLKKQL